MKRGGFVRWGYWENTSNFPVNMNEIEFMNVSERFTLFRAEK